MAKDYAKRQTKTGKKRKSSNKSRIYAVLLGILLGFFIIGLIYFKTKHSRSTLAFSKVAITPTHSIEKKKFIHSEEKPVSTRTDSANPINQVPQPKFDFYNTLSEDNLPSSSPKNNTTTDNAVTDNVPTTASTEIASNKHMPSTDIDISAPEATPKPKLTKPIQTETNLLASEAKQRLEKNILQELIRASNRTNKKTETFTLQMIGLRERAVAYEFRNYLLLQGFTPHMKAVINSTGKTQYLIWCGPFSSLVAAKEQKKRLKTNLINNERFIIKKGIP